MLKKFLMLGISASLIVSGAVCAEGSDLTIREVDDDEFYDYLYEETETEEIITKSVAQEALENSFKALVNSNYFRCNFSASISGMEDPSINIEEAEILYGDETESEYSEETVEEGDGLSVVSSNIDGLVEYCKEPKRYHLKYTKTNNENVDFYENYIIEDNGTFIDADRRVDGGSWYKLNSDKTGDLIDIIGKSVLNSQWLEVSEGGILSDQGENYKILQISVEGDDLYNFISDYGVLIDLGTKGKLRDLSGLGKIKATIYYSYDINTELPNSVEIELEKAEGREEESGVESGNIVLDFNYTSEEIPIQELYGSKAVEETPTPKVDDLKEDYGDVYISSIDDPAWVGDTVLCYSEQGDTLVPCLVTIQSCDYDIRARDLVKEYGKGISYKDKDVYLVNYSIVYPNKLVSDYGKDFTMGLKDLEVVSPGKNYLDVDSGYSSVDTVFVEEDEETSEEFNDGVLESDEYDYHQMVLLLPKWFNKDFVLKIGPPNKEAYVLVKNEFSE